MNRSFCCRILASLLLSAAARAQTPSYEMAPINYSESKPHEQVADLQQAIEKQSVALTKSDDRGYLESLLKELKIPATSQTLVFSKTSFQRTHISPKNPRALYFNDDTYVGYIPGTDMIEVVGSDSARGSIFYTVDQSSSKIVRQTENCLQCHGASMTRDVPGLLVRSVFADSDGQPFLPAGTFVTTHASPLKERWGGWYVSGDSGSQTHMGNTLFRERTAQQPPEAVPMSKTPLTELSGLIDTSNYLSPHSDIVALMVLEHQTEAHNRMTRAAYGTLRALRDEKILNDAMGETAKPGEHSESTLSRIKSSCEPLAQYLLFSGETKLEAPIVGSSDFATEFSSREPRDAKGRSLRDFDLKTRLFKYPCSYLLYSKSFDGLPDVTKAYVFRRMFEVVSGKDTTAPFANLSETDRSAIFQIVRDTLPAARDAWK